MYAEVKIMQCEMFEGCCSERDFSSDMESQLMCMAYLAHRAILYEKIKQRIEHQEGEKLDKIAELLVEASKERQDIRKS